MQVRVLGVGANSFAQRRLCNRMHKKPGYSGIGGVG